jgi:uncharacterized protein
VIVYLDTSALLKLYLQEPGSEAVQAAVSGATCCTHLLAYAEMRAALAQAVRMRRVAPSLAQELVAAFEADWLQLQVVLPDEAMIRRAGKLAEQFGLRGYDSAHLAAVERIAVQIGSPELRFACFDEPLCRAAAALGIVALESPGATRPGRVQER